MLDPFYSAELLRETAAGIPNARLTLDDGTGHAMLGKDFQGELLRFLSADDIAPLGPRRRRPDLPRTARVTLVCRCAPRWQVPRHERTICHRLWGPWGAPGWEFPGRGLRRALLCGLLYTGHGMVRLPVLFVVR